MQGKCWMSCVLTHIPYHHPTLGFPTTDASSVYFILFMFLISAFIVCVCAHMCEKESKKKKGTTMCQTTADDA